MGYASADVRAFLMKRFSDEEFETFCFDHFPEAQNDFAAGMTKSEKIQLLIAYCQGRDLVADLFTTLQQARPEPYRQTFGAGPPPTKFDPGPVAWSTSLGAGLSPQASEMLLAGLISNHQRSIRYYLLFAVLLAGLGLVVAASGLLLPVDLVQLNARPFFSLGGIFVASLSALPFKEILNRREKVGIFETLRGSLPIITQGSAQGAGDVQQRIASLLWQVLERATVG